MVHPQLMSHCSFVNNHRGLDGLEEKSGTKLFQDIEAQFSLEIISINKDEHGLFGISLDKVWDKLGMAKIGWIDAVKAARASSPNFRTVVSKWAST